MFRRRLYVLLPALGGCLLVGGLLGVQLGHSAIASINPIHFQGAAPPPRPADPPVRASDGAAYAQAYGWPEGSAARAAECPNCAPAQETYAFVEAPSVPPAQRLAGPAWRDSTPVAEVEPWPAGEIRVRGAPEREIERYVDYPIEAEPEEHARDRRGGRDRGDAREGREDDRDYADYDVYEE